MTNYVGFDILQSADDPLSSDEEKDLLRRYKNGDHEAEDILVRRNLKLVLFVVSRIFGSTDDCEDYVSCGLIGLIRGLRAFDIGSSNRLSTFLYSCIWNELSNYRRTEYRVCGNGSIVVSLDEELKSDQGDDPVTRMDFLVDEDPDILKQIESKSFGSAAQKCLSKKLFTRNERLILSKLYGLNGEKERCIVEVASESNGKWTKQYVVKTRDRALMKIRRVMSDWGTA